MSDLLIGTRKGAWVLRDEGRRAGWRLEGPLFLGQIVNHFVADPRAPNVWMVAAKTGHLGPTIFRSADSGSTWAEAKRPPAFPKADDPASARAVSHTFWLQPGHASQPRVWWAGASPPGLFRSDDDGETWESVAGFNDHPMYPRWVPRRRRHARRAAAQPDRRRPARCGAHVSRHLDRPGCSRASTGAATWAPLNQGRGGELPSRPLSRVRPGRALHRPLAHAAPTGLAAEPLRHLSPRPAGRALDADRRGDAQGRRRHRLHHRAPRRATPTPPGSFRWTAPRCGRGPALAVGPPSTAPRDAGASWSARIAASPPSRRGSRSSARRSAPTSGAPVGLYLGATNGEVWMSADEGESWREIAARLPEIYSLAVAPALSLPRPWREPHDPRADPLAASRLHRRRVAARIGGRGGCRGADDLDRRFPGLKFRVIDEQDRVRKHMRLFVGQTPDARHRAPRCATATSC